MDGDIHVSPVNDKYPHVLEGVDCPCNPEISLEGATLIIVHNSFDFREIVEELSELDNAEGREVMCPPNAQHSFSIARTAGGIFTILSALLSVLIAGLIFIAEIYRSTARFIVGCMADRSRSGDGTGKADRS